MKKILMILTMSLSSLSAHAGLLDWFHFEPTAMCVAGAAGGYYSTSQDDKSKQGQNAAIGCAIGALLGYGINYYYDGKFGTQYQSDLKDKDRMIQEMQWSTAEKVIKGEDQESDGVLIVEQIKPAQRLPNGDIIMPTKVKKLIIPGEGARIGK